MNTPGSSASGGVSLLPALNDPALNVVNATNAGGTAAVNLVDATASATQSVPPATTNSVTTTSCASTRQETIPEDDVVVAGRRPRPEDIKGTTNNFYTGVEQGLTLPSSMPSNGSFPSEWLAANGLQEPPKGPTNQEPQNFQPPPQPAPMAPHWPQQEELRGVAEQVNLNAAANLIGSSVSTMQQLQAQHQLLLNLGGIIGHHQTMNLNHVGLLPPAAEVLAMNGGNQNPLLAATPGLGGNLPFAATAPPAGGSNFYHHPLTDRAAPFDPSLGINAAMAIAPPANRWPSNPAVPAYENGEFMKCLGDFPATSLGIGDANLVGGDWRLHYNPFVPMPGDYGDSLNNTFLHNRTEEEAEAAGAPSLVVISHVAVGEGMQVANLPDQHAETDDARHQSGDPSAGDPQRSSPEHQRRLSTSSNQGTLSSPDHGRSPTRATRSPTSTSRNKNKKNRTRSVSDAALTLAGGLRGGPESMSEHQNLTERLGALPTGPEGKAPGQEALYVPCDAFETISEPEEVRAHALGQKAAARCISSDPTSSPDPAHHLHSEIVATVCFLDDAAAAKEAIARLRTEGAATPHIYPPICLFRMNNCASTQSPQTPWLILILREQKLAIAIDIEGDELCRDGNICLIQACNEQSPVYLFDVSVLGTTLFEECGMRELLEAEDLLKVVFDGRADNDALWHIHKVRSRNLYDIQVLYHLKLKEAGSKLYVSEGWGKRPLHPMLLEYAACDVRYLLGMRDLWGQDAKMVVRLTEKRIEQAIFGKTTPRGQHMMERDFVIPQDEQPMRAST
eukprot:g14177.t1